MNLFCLMPTHVGRTHPTYTWDDKVRLLLESVARELEHASTWTEDLVPDAPYGMTYNAALNDLSPAAGRAVNRMALALTELISRPNEWFSTPGQVVLELPRAELAVADCRALQLCPRSPTAPRPPRTSTSSKARSRSPARGNCWSRRFTCRWTPTCGDG